MTIVALSFFSSFLLYVALGVLALVVTAALDRAMGREKALLLWAFAIVGITWVVKPAAPPKSTAAPPTLSFREPRLDPTKMPEPTGDPLARTPIEPATRNGFQEQSDTSPLPPVAIPEPPSVPFAFPLPPTIPGAGPAARRLYRGALPDTKTGDGSKIPDVPTDSFVAYTPKPEDVFDWIVIGGVRQYVWIKEIDGVKEDDPQFQNPATGLKWNLALKGTPPQWPRDWKTMKVKFAFVGSEDRAKTMMDNPAKVRRGNESERLPTADEIWTLRRSVDNLFVEACRAQGNTDPARLPIDALKSVAASMAEVGQTGKEDLGGWKKAIEVLKIALEQSRRPPSRPAGEILVAMIEAYRALHDESPELGILTAYLAGAAGAAQADASTWLGDLFLEHLFLPYGAEKFYENALSLQPQARGALLGRGDALSWMGRHDRALDVYRKAADVRSAPDASTRVAEAYLRAGLLPEAKSAVDQALASGSFDARALLARGAILYAAGDVAGAREAFAQAAVLPGDGAEGALARRHRAEALYDLGLAEWRLGHGDAARAAFDAADLALRSGAERGRTADESVATELGRALLQLSAGNVGEAADALERAREQAPTVAYVEMLAGWISATQGDAARARVRFENALTLAPDLSELDGWLADVRQKLAEAQVAAGVPVGEAAPEFEAAAKFAERAAALERKANPTESDFAAREALIRMRALHQSERKRFAEALKTAEATLARVREDKRALAVKGYCNYRLGAALAQAEKWDQSIRDFQWIVDLTSSKPDDPLRAYALDCLEKVKRWLSLEQRFLAFDETKPPPEWQTYEAQGIKVLWEEGQIRFSDRQGARDDGSPTKPTVYLRSDKMFDKDAFEELEVRLRIPTKDASGNVVNNLVFGVLVQPPGGSGLARGVGIGVFYDKGKVAVRVAGGGDPQWKDGDLHRVVAGGGEMAWESEGRAMRVLVRRTNDKEGTMTVEIGPDGGELVKVLEDKISGFRRARGPMELWLGGWSNRAEIWNVAVDDVRVVRRK